MQESEKCGIIIKGVVALSALIFSLSAIDEISGNGGGASCGGFRGECANPRIDQRLADAVDHIEEMNLPDTRKLTAFERLEVQSNAIYDERHIVPFSQLPPRNGNNTTIP